MVSQLIHDGEGRWRIPGKKRAVLELCETVASVERRARQQTLARRGLERRGRSRGERRAFMAGVAVEGEEREREKEDECWKVS